MTFYKIIQNGIVTDIGYNFLEWNQKYHRMFFCDVNKAQFVISMDNNSFFRDDWMKVPPEDATGYKTAKIIIIDKDEYDDLYNRLSNKLTVSDEVEEDSVDIVQPIVEKPETDKKETVLTVAEMQKLLLAQQEKINELMDLLGSK